MNLLRLALFAAATLDAAGQPYTGFSPASQDLMEEIRRCEGPDGRKIFSHTPCEAGTKDLDVAQAIAVEVLPPRTTLSFRFYDIGGSTTHEVMREIHENGPRGGWNKRPAAGVTSSQFSVSSSIAGSQTRCSLRKVQVVLDVTITLPRWTAPPQASSWLRAEVNRANKVLEEHEFGHYVIAREAALELTRRLAGTPPSRRCVDVYKGMWNREKNFHAHLANLQREYHLREWDAGRR